MGTIRIAIDGPAGAGKSTAAKRLAKELGFLYMDTGAMYRAVGLKALRLGLDPQDEIAVSRMMEDTRLDLKEEADGLSVWLDGEEVSALIRTSEVSLAASAVSQWRLVREKLVETQREIAHRANVVMDGRDIGSVVLPDAQVKLFLTASPQMRARRRAQEMRDKDPDVDEGEILRQILARDAQDSGRAVSPLVCAADAIVVDNSMYEPEDTYREILHHVNEVLGR